MCSCILDMLKKRVLKILVKDSSKPKQLINAYNEKCFWVKNGPVLSNLTDLLRAFSCMTEIQFAHHVTKEKNDFAQWVEEVLLDKECARLLQKAGSPQKASAVVEKCLKEYQF